MTDPTQTLEADLGLLRDAWLHALAGTGLVPDSVQGSIEQMQDAGLIALLNAASQLNRDAEALLARVAAEISTRSPAELGADGLARRQGFQNPSRLVAASTGGSLGEAARFVAVGTATAERHALSGEQMPARHPHVARALATGSISVDAASAITRMFDRVALRADPDQAVAVENLLAEQAARLPLDLLLRVIREAEARLDQDGVEPREEQLRDDRSVTIREDRSGMVHLSARLDPEAAAPVKVAIEAIVTRWIRGRRDGLSGPDDAAVPDDRSIPQMQADALVMIARHALGCDRMPLAPAMSMIVRTEMDTLVNGLGHADIDGLTQPISAATVRRMAASAGLIPAVFGGDSLPLDLGRSQRLFSRGQRLALAERDGGCACCGLDVAYAEAHHIRWWERDTGPTDLANGVLLCRPCHTRIHTDDWVVSVIDGQVWFTPPPHVDPARTPRIGGRARFGLPRDRAA